MLENLAPYISIIFIITTCITVFLFYKASHSSKRVLSLIIIWASIQAILGYSSFYLDTSLPPRFSLAIIPPLLFIILLFFIQKGKTFISKLNIKILTLLHTIRIPIEFVLYWLFLHQSIPELMTFSGRNFDILAGITAPFIYYFGYIHKIASPKFLLGWNLVCLFLLLFIVVNAILSFPFPFQQFGFDQPNIALLYFPFVWLASVVVPIVLFSHLVSIQHLSKQLKILK
ncbi:hypothetical protein IWQ47_001433 [Aquimarina sp. EL_43]|uniref:hypothetical protein n=1 Tax=unclassified Aquimarina TaxID=2627091 RepID=UPI0018C92549|nr:MULTISPECIES: hypothetical protein [unclassified Aquimarina]MBG6149264.1 hypothetical protein [Aquimarina sp. EL_32]MBG6168362.1 hypothetical protein [Aquimarina sp. EL_43]